MSELIRRVRRWLSDPFNKCLAGLTVLGILIAFVIAGWKGIFLFALGFAVAWFWPRIRQRITRFVLINC